MKKKKGMHHELEEQDCLQTGRFLTFRTPGKLDPHKQPTPMLQSLIKKRAVMASKSKAKSHTEDTT